MNKKRQAKAIPPVPAGSVEPGKTPSYMVPGAVAIALNTGRSQFINGLVGEVRKGHVIEPAQVIGMLELIRDWTDAKYADDRRNAIVKENLTASKVSMAELRIQVNKLTRQLEDTVATATRVAHRHDAGPLGPEDDPE